MPQSARHEVVPRIAAAPPEMPNVVGQGYYDATTI